MGLVGNQWARICCRSKRLTTYRHSPIDSYIVTDRTHNRIGVGMDLRLWRFASLPDEGVALVALY
jgi:hypothetical protein